MLKILDRYILSELIKPFFAGIGAFIIIMLSNTLFLYADLIVRNGIPVDTVAVLLLYNMPAIMVVTFPVAYLFSTLLVLGRFAKDTEITAFRACGISFIRIILPILIIALIISYIGYWFNETVVPWANQQCVVIYKDMMVKQPIPPIKENYFFKDASNRYFYIGKINRTVNLLQNILILDQIKSGYPQIITAKYANREKTKWVLKDGMVRKFNGKGYISYECKFVFMEIQLNLDPNVFFSDQKSVQELSTGDALKEINKLSSQGVDIKAMMVDFHIKYSLPLATFFAALIAAPIGVRFSRMGSYIGVSASIALIFVWYVLYSYGRELGSVGAIPPFIGAWIHNFIFGLVGIIMLINLSRK